MRSRGCKETFMIRILRRKINNSNETECFLLCRKHRMFTCKYSFLHYKIWTLERISDEAVREKQNVPRNFQTHSGGSGGQDQEDRVSAQDPWISSCLCFFTIWKTPSPACVADVNDAAGDGRSSLVPRATSPFGHHCGDFFL